jgi:GNAT superfamily N-acetyltransferase
MSDDLATPSYIGSLGDGLIRRWSTAADTEKFAVLLGTVFRDEDDELPNPRPMAEARLLMSPNFPYMTPNDVAVVEDTSKPERPLVACTTFWRHTWSYAGIPFGVTRPELVAADPAYRNRGLIRAVFEMIHARSAAEGHLLQGITGIPYFYRQFGYEYVLDLDGSRTTYFSLIPDKKGDDAEPCTLRRARLEDIDRITALYNQRRSSSLLWHEAAEARRRQVIAAWDDPAVRDQDVLLAANSGQYWMILDAAEEICGYAWIAARRWSRSLLVHELALAPGTDPHRLVPSLLRALRDYGQGVPAVKATMPPCSEIAFALGRTHPLYDLLGDALAPKVEPPYAWYIRIPDVPAFLRLIAPALEERLAQSVLTGYTGDLKIDLYRGGLHLRFEQGKLVCVEPWRAPIHGDEDTALGCPPLTFLQLLLSYRSVDELRAIFPDIWVKDEYRLLITTLFPKLPSMVEPLG